MNSNADVSLVTVYSTPNPFDAGIVKAMLADEDIPSFIEDANCPFPGLAAAPCHLMVSSEFESQAQQLIEEHKNCHLNQIEPEME